MPEEMNEEFINAYTGVLLASWTNTEERAALLADPAAYVTAKGLTVEPGAIVRVDESPHDGLFTQGEVSDAWSGTPGVHVLLVPATPVVDLDELNEAELETVTGGVKVNVIVACVVNV